MPTKIEIFNSQVLAPRSNKLIAKELDSRLLAKDFDASSNGGNSYNTTRSNTPERTVQEKDDHNELIIDVKPKKKVFKTVEERREFVKSYKMKLKTELCKNFELRGWCKFGDNCSFAHGRHELQEKKHLHEKYKTRPCQQYHQQGHCSYGIRCQYLHKEAFTPNIFHTPSTEFAWNAERSNYSYELLDEIWRMSNSSIKVEKILNKIPCRNRLPIFNEIAPEESL